MNEIEIIIDKDGEVQIDVLNGRGPECVTLAEPFIKAVGKIKKDVKKTSFYEHADSVHHIDISNTGK